MNQMRRTLNVVLGLLISTAAAARAQAPAGAAGPQQAPPAGEIKGNVIDGDANMPVARASITVRTRPAGTLVTGAVAKDDGTFRVTGLRPGKYYLRVTSIGYGPVSTPEFTVVPASLNVDAGTIKMAKVAVALGDVEVKAERDAVTIEPDRNTYRAKDVAATANNASEILDKVPSVAVDGDGKVSLRGNENVVVQINGRPAPMSGAQLGQFLKTLPSAVVDRIEVITTPSARQDPEGMAGIINIQMKSNVDLGWSGGFNVASATETGRYNGSGNLGYQVGPWTTLSTYGYNADDRDIDGINDRIKLFSGNPLSYTNQDILGNQTNWGHNLSTTVDYKLNTRDVLTNAINLNLRKFDDNSLAEYSELNASQTPTAFYNRLRDSDVKSYTIDYTTAWRRTFDPKLKHELYTELRYTNSHDDDHTDQSRIDQCGPGQLCTAIVNGPVDLQADHTLSTTQNVNAQLDYTKAFANRRKIETGFKGTGRWLDRDYDVTKAETSEGPWTPSSLSNDLNFNEDVGALYAQFSQGVNKFDLSAGVRGEIAHRDFTLAKDNKSYPYDYSSLYPSAIAVYNFNPGFNAKVGYSRRVRRPGTQELNPFPQFFDPQNVFFGNPNLSPEYTDAIELGLTKSGKYGTAQLSPFYRRTSNIIRVQINTADTFEGRDVTSISFQNLATGTSWGTDANGQLRFGPKGSIMGNFNVFKMVTDGGSTSVVGSDAIAWGGRINATYNATKSLTLNGVYNYRAPMKIEGGKFSAQQQTFFSIRQKIMQDKAAISLRLQDPFNTIGMRIKTGDDNITQITARKFGVRAAFLTFSYMFGQTPKIKPVQQAPQDQPSTGFPSGG
jgi:outer membrane receptor protein involved in Fe transport